MRSVSVLIPTLNAGQWLPRQLAALNGQTEDILEILLIDSQSDDDTLSIAKADPRCKVIPVSRADFDHGGTRDLAARASRGDYLWFLTQDAIPADEHCLKALLDAVKDPSVACAYGRQIAEPDAPILERLNREANYPPQSFTRGEEDIQRMQVRAFFLSDTCCLYKRETYFECGGFDKDLPTNEDMLFSSRLLRAGYRTAYCAQARVWHTHRTTLAGWYRRSFDVGAFMEMHGEQLCGVKAVGAGKKYALEILKKLLKMGRVCACVHFCFVCLARLLGDHDGHRYRRYPERAVLKKTQNRAFWRRYFARQSADKPQEWRRPADL